MGFFEPAVASAIDLFGLNSGAMLTAVVGVLIEVPVMPAAVRVIGRTRPWDERRSGVPDYAACCPGGGVRGED
jgi:ACR3 family arsenite transporter